MDIKSSNKLRAQEEIKKRRNNDLKGLELAKQQEKENEATKIKVVERINGGIKIKYISKDALEHTEVPHRKRNIG